MLLLKKTRHSKMDVKRRMSERLAGREALGAGQCGVNFNMPKRFMDGERDKGGKHRISKHKTNSMTNQSWPALAPQYIRSHD